MYTPRVPPADDDLSAVLSALDDPSFLAPFAPSLGSGAEARAPSSAGEEVTRDGWTAIDAFVSADEARALVASIEGLAAKGVPPLFVYAFDATWALGVRAAELFSRALGAAYGVLPDAWAFVVPPGPEHAGWAPHRGSYELARDRSAPDSINVWVALSDVTLDHSCMFVVPFADDPAYPDDLASHAASASGGKALPARAGTALAWNANLLHWGGPSSARATTPRISITFTLVKDATRDPAQLVSAPHAKKLDVLAQQILVYAKSEKSFPDLWKRWATTRSTMAGLAKSLKESRGT